MHFGRKVQELWSLKWFVGLIAFFFSYIEYFSSIGGGKTVWSLPPSPPLVGSDLFAGHLGPRLKFTVKSNDHLPVGSDLLVV